MESPKEGEEIKNEYSYIKQDGEEYNEDHIIKLGNYLLFTQIIPEAQAIISPLPIPLFKNVEEYIDNMTRGLSDFAPSSQDILQIQEAQLTYMENAVLQGYKVIMIFHTGTHWFTGMCSYNNGELHVYLADAMKGVENDKQEQIQNLIAEAVQQILPNKINIHELFCKGAKDYAEQNKAPDIQPDDNEEIIEEKLQLHKQKLEELYKQCFSYDRGQQGTNSCGAYAVEYFKIMLSSHSYEEMNEQMVELDKKNSIDLRQEHYNQLTQSLDNNVYNKDQYRIEVMDKVKGFNLMINNLPNSPAITHFIEAVKEYKKQHTDLYEDEKPESYHLDETDGVESDQDSELLSSESETNIPYPINFIEHAESFLSSLGLDINSMSSNELRELLDITLQTLKNDEVTALGQEAQGQYNEIISFLNS